MNKAEYMLGLERAIIRLPRTVRDEILYDYEEHFRLGKEAGKSEEEIARELGTPEEIAAPYVENLPPPPPHYEPNMAYTAQKSDPSSFQKVVIALVIIFINCAFIIPTVGGLIFGLWVAFGAVCFGLFIGGIALIIASFFQPIVTPVAMIFGGLALLAITFPLCYGFYKVTVWLVKIIVKYVKYCINIVNKGGIN